MPTWTRLVTRVACQRAKRLISSEAAVRATRWGVGGGGGVSRGAWWFGGAGGARQGQRSQKRRNISKAGARGIDKVPSSAEKQQHGVGKKNGSQKEHQVLDAGAIAMLTS